MWKYILLIYTRVLCSEAVHRHFGTSLIMGGSYANISDFPHAAALFILLDDEGWLCGSAILNQRVLLTAAHCFELYTIKHTISVSVGSVDVEKGTGYDVMDHVIHERYNKRTMSNDVALVKTMLPIEYEVGKVQRIAIMSNPPDDRVGWIAGWGLIQENPQKYPLGLKCLEQTMWDEAKCIQQNVPKGVICAEESSFSTPSSGDSGSALVIRKFIEVGILSFKNISPSYFGAYTSVKYHYRWITTNMMKLYCRHKNVLVRFGMQRREYK